MANKKLELENELSAVKREIDALEGSKYRYNEELVAQRQALENLRLLKSYFRIIENIV